MAFVHESVYIYTVDAVLAGFERVADLIEHAGHALFLHLVPGGDVAAADADLGEAFDVLEAIDFASADEREGDAFAPGASGASDAVDVVFGIVGEVEVDDEVTTRCFSL